MHIFLISDLDSTHTLKWVTALHRAGVRLTCFGLGEYDAWKYENFVGLTIHGTLIDRETITGSGALSKLKYLSALPRLRKLIQEAQPDLVHAHRISSNGFFAALVGIRVPLVISSWGIDVYEFPNRSRLHRWITKFTLRQADVLLTTSRAMALEQYQYTNKAIYQTPFGIDPGVFYPKAVMSPATPRSATQFLPEADEPQVQPPVVIGTIKIIEHIYGIDTLIQAFTLVVQRVQQPVRLLIVGGGNKLDDYRRLVKQLGIADYVDFTGRIPFPEIAPYHREIDIFVALSRWESFGVAILEASASAVPVVVSDADGPREVVENGITGIIVPKEDPEAAAAALCKLVQDPEYRKKLGRAGRQHVLDNYQWSDNVDRMIAIYQSIIDKKPLPVEAIERV